jgi:hypothetical protein
MSAGVDQISTIVLFFMVLFPTFFVIVVNPDATSDYHRSYASLFF